VAVSPLKTLHGGFRSETAITVKKIYNGYTYQIHKKFKILPLAPLGTPWAQTGG
jgi:hypothetical protein